MTRFIPSHLLVVLSLSVLLAPSICLSAQETAKDSQFIAHDNGIVLDTKTGLEWYPGPDKSTNWYDAKRWVESLTAIAGGGWRMPTRKELKTVYKKGKKCNITPVLKITGCWVWSGETKGSSGAWGYDYSYDPSEAYSFGSGFESWYSKDFSDEGVRCLAVRSR